MDYSLSSTRMLLSMSWSTSLCLELCSRAMFLPTRSFLSTRSTSSQRLRTRLTATRTGQSKQKILRSLVSTMKTHGLKSVQVDLHFFRLSFGTTIRPSLMTVWPPITCWSPSTEPGTSWLHGKSPNVWELREIMVKQEAEARREFLKNSVGADMSTNTGRKERSLSNNARLKFLVSSFNTTPKKDYIQMVAHELMRS